MTRASSIFGLDGYCENKQYLFKYVKNTRYIFFNALRTNNKLYFL